MIRRTFNRLYYRLTPARTFVFLLPPLLDFRLDVVRVILKEISHTRPKTVLEVGFSDAFLTKRLSHLLPFSKIDAIDTSDEAVKRAQKLNLPNVNFKLEDFFEVKTKYDLLVSMHVFVLFNHEEAIVKMMEISDMAMITLVGRSLFTRLHRHFHRFMAGMDVNLIEPEEYEHIVRSLGFRCDLIRINPLEKSYLVLMYY